MIAIVVIAVVFPTASLAEDSPSTTAPAPEPPPEGTRTPETGSAAPTTESPPPSLPKSYRLQWDFSWAAGLNYEIRQPYEIPAPTESLQRLFGEEVALRGHIGGKLAVDAAAFASTAPVAGLDNGIEIRRLRLNTVGDATLLLGLPITYKIEFQYVQGATGGVNSSGKFELGDCYLAYKDIPYLGTLYVGNLQTPVGLEGVGSSRDLTFMEPAAVIDALTPGVRGGVMFEHPVFGERMTWSVGAFANTRDFDLDNLSNAASVIGRVTWLPVYEGDGTRLVHVGLSAGYGFAGGETLRARSRPESHLAPFVVDTGTVDATRSGLLGLEAASVNGPLSFQGELYHAFVGPPSGPMLGFTGGYVYGSWFVTGENRPYDRKTGVFSRFKPSHDLSWRNGSLGSWEIALRYSYLDLNDGPVHGGRMNIVTAGVNWYWNPYMKMRFNYNYAAVNSPLTRSGIHIMQTRFELDF